MPTKPRPASIFDLVDLPAPEPVAPSAPAEPSLPIPQGWADLTPEQRARAVSGIRAAHAAQDFNTATALIVALVGGEEARTRFAEIVEIDGRAASRGYITESDMDRRASLTIWALDRLRFDPRRADGPPAPHVPPPAPAASVSPRPVAVAAPRPLALGEGISAPLRAGDWAGLWARVQAGALSKEEAEAFGALWIARQ